MKQNTNAGLPQEENPIASEVTRAFARLRELNPSAYASASFTVSTELPVPQFKVVLGSVSSHSADLQNALDNLEATRVDEIADIRSRARRLGLTVTETAAAEL